MEFELRQSPDRSNPIGFENLYDLSRTVDILFEEVTLSELIQTLTFLKAEVIAQGQKNGFSADDTINFFPTQAVELLVRMGQLETFLCKLFEQRGKHLYKESRRIMKLDGY